MEALESQAFKCVTFGGFDKQDVINYIEKNAKENAATVEQLQKENQDLQSENETLKKQLSTLQNQIQESGNAVSALKSELGKARVERTELENLRAERSRLSEQVAQLRPNAEAYVQFRNQVGDIECDARKRSNELEASTKAKLCKLTEDFHSQYQNLVTTFDATSTHVTGELRKVEVNLTQLPRALDQVGAELKELERILGTAPERPEER